MLNQFVRKFVEHAVSCLYSIIWHAVSMSRTILFTLLVIHRPYLISHLSGLSVVPLCQNAWKKSTRLYLYLLHCGNKLNNGVKSGMGYNYLCEFHNFDMVLTDNCLWPSIFDDLLPKRLCAACLFTQAYSLAHTQLYFWFLSRSTKMGNILLR